MDINFVCLEKLTPQERERCFKNNLCLHCRKPGNQANECPTFTTQTQKPTFQKKPQQPNQKVVRIEEQVEEIMKEENIAKFSVQDF